MGDLRPSKRLRWSPSPVSSVGCRCRHPRRHEQDERPMPVPLESSIGPSARTGFPTHPTLLWICVRKIAVAAEYTLVVQDPVETAPRFCRSQYFLPDLRQASHLAVVEDQEETVCWSVSRLTQLRACDPLVALVGRSAVSHCTMATDLRHPSQATVQKG